MKMAKGKVLIAHHGELARRIQVSCHSRGLLSVAIYTEDEIGATYLSSSHQAFKLSGIGGHAYLNQDEIIAIAHKAGAMAIHPGYGFLSENAHFARRVIDEGFIWIGPDPQAIEIMGNKIEARNLALQNAIPVITGKHFMPDDQGVACALGYAQSIGYPVVIKNPLAGGGKGMRCALNSELFLNEWQAVLFESRAQNLSSLLLVEKYILNGRHIEIQVIGDGQNYIHAYERECSLQRRHQKIIEEAPCLFISQNLKEKMYEAACRLARAVSYRGIGTIEFLVADDHFYFLEMNTRLQVEHSVTEMVTGIDLVDEQFQIALLGKMSYSQDGILLRGHAIEARVYAEDPTNNYQPCSGLIVGLRIPHLAFVRIDHDLHLGGEITSFFDPMIAKITAFGKNRSMAYARLSEALRCTIIAGIKQNITFLLSLLKHERIYSGNFHTMLLGDIAFLITLDCFKQENESNRQSIKGPALCAAYRVLCDDRLSRAGVNNKTSSHEKIASSFWRKQQWE